MTNAPTPPTPTPQLLTRHEVAARLALSVVSIDRLIGRRELRAVRIGRAVRVRISDLERFTAGLEVVR